MNATPSQIDAAVALLRAGELVAFPTETVYGLGADARNDRAVARVFEAKGRPAFNPLIAHVADFAAAEAIGDFNDDARLLGKAIWPGPLTLVVPRAKQCAVSALASAGLDSIAIRIPAHAVAHALLRAAGFPVVAPSANPSGGLSPTTAAHARAGLGEKVHLILDGGQCAIGLESTVVSCLGPAPQILRSGGLARDAIEAALGAPIAFFSNATSPRSPGQLDSHYAPRAALRLNALAPRGGEAWLGFGKSSVYGRTLSARGDLVEAAANLFRMLHEIDAEGARLIAVAPIPMTGLGEAINDRLKRAAAPRP
jgi:L-threonylcarbamoyladenylate synthase